jgi:hypothetical protein
MHIFFIQLHHTVCSSILSNFHLNYNLFYYCCFSFKKMHLFYIFIYFSAFITLITRKVAKKMWFKIGIIRVYRNAYSTWVSAVPQSTYTLSTNFTVWHQMYTRYDCNACNLHLMSSSYSLPSPFCSESTSPEDSVP